MSWFRSIGSHKNKPIPPAGMDAEHEKQWRISLLTDDEYKAFGWLRQGYTERWTAETMLLDRKTANKLFASVYCKLSVTDDTEVTRVYRTVQLKPEELPAEEDTL